MFYVRFYIISELALILDNLKDNDVLMVPVPIYIVSSVYFYAMVLLYPHVFVPSEQYPSENKKKKKKKKNLILHYAASFALSIIFFKSITRFVKSFAALILLWFLFL